MALCGFPQLQRRYCNNCESTGESELGSSLGMAVGDEVAWAAWAAPLFKVRFRAFNDPPESARQRCHHRTSLNPRDIVANVVIKTAIR